jgi:hypothetical protein
LLRDLPLGTAPSLRFGLSVCHRTDHAAVCQQRRRFFQQRRQVDGRVVVQFHQHLRLRAKLHAPLQTHHVLVRQVVVVLQEVSLNEQGKSALDKIAEAQI